jgi:hypothetical protein
MAYIRSQDRMVYQSVFAYVSAQLNILGWKSSTVADLPFGATVPITLLEEQLDPKLAAMAPNTVAMSEGAQPDDQEGELGASYGGLWIIRHTLFVDIYGESIGVAKALSSDLRGMFTGKLPGTSRYLPMTDYSLNPPAPAAGHMLRFEDVEVDRPLGGASKLRWEVVKATAVHEYNATEGTL